MTESSQEIVESPVVRERRVLEYLERYGTPPCTFARGFRDLRAWDPEIEVSDTVSCAIIIAVCEKLPGYAQFVMDTVESNPNLGLRWDATRDGWGIYMVEGHKEYGAPIVYRNYDIAECAQRGVWYLHLERDLGIRMNTLWTITEPYAPPFLFSIGDTWRSPPNALMFDRDGIIGVMPKNNTLELVLDICESPSVAFESLHIFKAAT